MTIAVIPARGGSTRIPRKNIRLFHGKPIIAYSIEAAQKSDVFTQIVVSTDDDEIAAVAEQYGAEVWHRDPAYGRDEVGTQAVTRECLMGLEVVNKHRRACCIYPCAPMIDPGDLEEAAGLLKPQTHYVISVYADKHLVDAGRWYFGYAEDFINEVPLMSAGTALYPIPANRCCDINTEEDWQRAEQMYAALEKS